VKKVTPQKLPHGNLSLLAFTSATQQETILSIVKMRLPWDNIFAAFPPQFGGAGQANFSGISQTTHLGRATQGGTLALHPTSANDIVIPGEGTETITAANGDQLTFKFTGNLYVLTSEGKGTFTFTSGTGRFAQATGGGTFYALIEPAPTNQTMTVVLDGTISY
jgi:hypothetical protein